MVTNHLSCGGQGTYYIILAKLIFVKGIKLMSRFLSFFFFFQNVDILLLKNYLLQDQYVFQKTCSIKFELIILIRG